MPPMTDTAKATLRDAARRTRMRTMRATLTTTIVVAAVAYGIKGEVAAEGALLGGAAGAMGFWAMALRLEQIALVRPERLAVAATAWTFYRILIYGAFLTAAYALDRETYYGLFGAMAGLLSTRITITMVGVRQAKTARAGAKP